MLIHARVHDPVHSRQTLVRRADQQWHFHRRLSTHFRYRTKNIRCSHSAMLTVKDMDYGPCQWIIRHHTVSVHDQRHIHALGLKLLEALTLYWLHFTIYPAVQNTNAKILDTTTTTYNSLGGCSKARSALTTAPCKEKEKTSDNKTK